MTPGRDAVPADLPCAEITGRIMCAIRQVQGADALLLAIDVNEVTVSHRLAMYLEPLFRDWHVDMEYNRIGRSRDEDDRERVKRREGDPVYPDIVIHERGEANNLVVIELKLSTNRESREDVADKLRYFRNAEILDYRHGVLVDVPAGDDHPGEPYIECITCGRDPTL